MHVTAAELNRRFREIRDRALHGTVTITHHGKPSLKLMSVEQYSALADPAAFTPELIYGQLAMIVDNLGDGFLTIDRDWKIRAINRVAESFIGRSREELIGKEFAELFGGRLSAGGRDQIMRSMEGGEIVTEARVSDLHPNRKIVVTTFPMPPPYDGVGALFANITEQERMRVRLAEVEATLDALFELAEDSILIIADSGERIERWGKGAEILLGWSRDEVIGRPLSALLAPGERTDGEGPLTFLTRSGKPLVAAGRTTKVTEGSARSLRILKPVA